MGRRKGRGQERHTPIRPTVEPGQEGPAAQERARRRQQSLYEQQAGEVLFQAWRLQSETGKGVGYRDRKKDSDQGGSIERRGN